MQEMHPDVGYLKGGFNTISDFLSRYKGMNATRNGLTQDAGVGVSAVELTVDCFKPRQQADKWCKGLMDQLAAKPYREDGYYCQQNKLHVLLRKDGVLLARPGPRQGFIDNMAWRAVVQAAFSPVSKVSLAAKCRS